MEMGLFQTLNLPPELLERQKQYMAMSYEQRLQADAIHSTLFPEI